MKHRRTGQALVEFALVIPILLIALMAIFDFGRAIFAYNSVSNAARVAVRTAIVDQNVTTIQTQALTQTTGLEPTSLEVDTSALTPDCVALKIGCQAQVTVTYEWRAITPIIGSLLGPIDLSSTSVMRIERVYTSP